MKLVARFLVLPLVVSLAAPAYAASEKQACIAASEKAQGLRTEGHMIAARQQLLVCARDVCPTIVRKDCARWVAEVDEALPSIVLAAKDGAGHDVTDVRVSVDDQPFVDKLDGKSQVIDPGSHVFKFERDGVPPVTETVLVREGEKNRIVQIQWTTPATGGAGAAGGKDAGSESAKPIPPATWILGGIGVIGLAGFTAFGISARSQASDLRSTCAPACEQSDVDAVKRKALFADVSLGVGLVAFGAATYFWLAAPTETKEAKSSARKPSTTVGFSPLVGGGAVQIAGSF